MRKHWLYFKYVIRHKYFVFVEALKLGVPIWLALFHDWDKFLPRMWFAYADYFYGKRLYKTTSDIPGGLKSCGIYPRTDADAQRDLNLAWNAHQNRCKHHWQYWCLIEDSGSVIPLEMPDVYVREMLADWRGAGRALGNPDTVAWYLEHYDVIRLHPNTRIWIDTHIGIPPTESEQAAARAILTDYLDQGIWSMFEGKEFRR